MASKKTSKQSAGNSTLVINHVDEFSAARASSIIFGVLGGLIVAIYVLFLLLLILLSGGVGASALYSFLATLVVGAVIVVLITALLGFKGFVLGWIAAVVYNAFLGNTCGIEIQLDQKKVAREKSKRKRRVRAKKSS